MLCDSVMAIDGRKKRILYINSEEMLEKTNICIQEISQN